MLYAHFSWNDTRGDNLPWWCVYHNSMSLKWVGQAGTYPAGMCRMGIDINIYKNVPTYHAPLLFKTSIMYQSVSRWKMIITQCILKYHISAHCCRNVDVSFHGHSSWIRIPINNIIQWPNSVQIYISQEYNFGFQSNVVFSVAIYPCNVLALNTIIISPLLIFTSDDLKGVSESDQPLSWNYNTQGFSNGGVHNMNYQMMLTLTT